jgi:SAM-dependent methyltransferase
VGPRPRTHLTAPALQDDVLTADWSGLIIPTQGEWLILAMRAPAPLPYTGPMSAPETFQIPIETAEVYEAKFVPALFADWAPHVVDMGDVAAGHSVLDVACGTGIVARAAAERVGPTGWVVGVDLNQAMLTVAERVCPGVELRQADVAALPFEDATFDVALCQMALMFFPDRPAALREMGRVVKADGTVVVMVPSGLGAQPAYRPLVELAARHAGPEAVAMLSAYWACGDLEDLIGTARAAGLEVLSTRTRLGTARFDSIDEFVSVEVESTPVRQRLTDREYDALRREANDVLEEFTTADGTAAIPIEGHLLAARPR